MSVYRRGRQAKGDEPTKEEGFKIDTSGGTPWNPETSFPNGASDWEDSPKEDFPLGDSSGDSESTVPPKEESVDVLEESTSNEDMLSRVDEFQKALEEAKADGKIEPNEVMGLLGNMMEMVQLLIHSKPPRKSKVAYGDLRSRRAKVFDTKKQLEQYLKEHPKADKSKHTVQEKNKPSMQDKSKGKPSNGKPNAEEHAEEKEKEILQKSNPKLIEKFKQELPQYKITLVARKDGKLDEADIENVKDIQSKLKWLSDRLEKGIKESADICNMKPPVCEGNMGITRDNMPQIMDKSVKELLNSEDQNDQKKGQAAVDAGADPDDDRPVMKQLMEAVHNDGVAITENVKIPVGKLKATQSEIKAGKTYGIANAFLTGELPERVMGNPIIATSDGHILDGHHRYSAALTIDPHYEMNVTVIDMPMKDFLMRAHQQPGVFRADLDDNIIPDDQPVDLGDGPTKIQRKGKSKKSSLSERVAAHYMMVEKIARDFSGGSWENNIGPWPEEKSWGIRERLPIKVKVERRGRIFAIEVPAGLMTYETFEILGSHHRMQDIYVTGSSYDYKTGEADFLARTIEDVEKWFIKYRKYVKPDKDLRRLNL